MGNKRTILFLLGGIAFCLPLVWYTDWQGRSVERVSGIEARWLGHPTEEVSRIVIERSDVHVEVRRNDGVWMLYAPFSGRADQGAVARFLDALEKATVSDTIGFSEMRRRELSFRDFGLAPSVARVTLSGGEEQEIFSLGLLTPLQGEVYARRNEAEQIVTLPAELFRLLPQTVDRWRSRDLVACDASKIKVIEIKKPGKPFIKLSKEKNTWRLIQPVDEPADDQRVERMLAVLCGTQAIRFIWPTVGNIMEIAETDSLLKARMEVYGLGMDLAMQVAVQESAEAEPVRLMLESKSDVATGWCHALVNGGDTVVAVSNEVRDVLSCSMEELRDRRLFFEKPEHVRRLEISRDEQNVVLIQTNRQWQMQAPILGSVDSVNVADAVDQVLQLRAVSMMLQTNGTPADVQEMEGRLLGRIELATEHETRKLAFVQDLLEPQFCRVSMSSSPMIYRVEIGSLPAVLRDAEGVFSLYDKTVVNVDPAVIRRIHVTREEGRVEMLQRENPGGIWRLGAEMAHNTIRTEAVDAFLKQLHPLSAARVSRSGVSAADLERYGLHAPRVEITLDVDTKDAIRKTILLGGAAGEGFCYALLRGRDVIFVLDEETQKRLTSPLTRQEE